jgi:hypothetical protein
MNKGNFKKDYIISDTDVFFKSSDETFEAFYVRVFNFLIINNRLAEAVRIHVDPTWTNPKSNWIAIDYINISNK